MRRKIHETNRFTTWYVYVSRQLVHAKCQEICRYSQVENAYARARPVKKPVSTRARPSFTVTQSWSWLETKNSEGILRQEDAPSSYEFYFEIINIEKENDDVERKRGKQKSVRRYVKISKSICLGRENNIVRSRKRRNRVSTITIVVTSRLKATPRPLTFSSYSTINSNGTSPVDSKTI